MMSISTGITAKIHANDKHFGKNKQLSTKQEGNETLLSLSCI